MIEDKKVTKMLYGGDYNPEQWGEDIWAEDMRLFNLAGIDVVTLNVFSWAMLQPSENTYNFETLDKIIDNVTKHGLNICLATSTAAHPAWMARKYPDILRVEFNGMKRKFGSRHNSCPNSPTYRKYSVELARRIAERYKNQENIVAWHISNEYGGECYCENCEKAFRVWLKDRYKTIEAVNAAWDTAFWGHTFYDFDDIVAPNMLSEHFAENRTTFQGISLDYRRFMSDSILDCYRMEYETVKSITPDIQVTTNLMGFFKPLDYQKWAKYMDFVSWDNYPSNEATTATKAMNHDLMRGIKQGKPFCLMEQTPSVTNWLPYNALKRPGVMRLWSYQAVAHGADTVMFFQMRRSIGACEKYHGAIIDHCGHENTRVFREAAALGAELKQLGDATLGARHKSEVAILFDWDNWWAIEYSAGPSVNLKYYDEILRYYETLSNMNISTDIIGVDDDLSQYKMVIAPVLYMTKGDYDEKIRTFVKNGGTFITTFFSGYVNETDLVYTGGYPGKLRDIMGLWVEEQDALPPEMENHFTYDSVRYPATLICDLSHSEGAEVLTTYEEDFYAGMPALTKNAFGNGHAYYVCTASNQEFYKHFLGNVMDELNIKPVCITAPDVEATIRSNDKGDYLFLLNHAKTDSTFALNTLDNRGGQDLLTNTKYSAGETITMKPTDVLIIKLD